ncbi:pleiotropic drug resistance protein 3-like [Senna tora]|uniref:Pleiotropic drug resistance protein 3-like n=1 Tax=Senna tora TaxID=362788 RepID=A0A834SN62_9FABA|nr:pleiotropic drug resistance protein 3-like [Senna tora]
MGDFLIGGLSTGVKAQATEAAENTIDLGSGRDQESDNEIDYAVQWAAIERLPTYNILRSCLLNEIEGQEGSTGKRVVDVAQLGANECHLFVERLIKPFEHDNLQLLKKIKKRIDNVEAECEVIRGKPLPTLWNSLTSVLFNLGKLLGTKSRKDTISIINDVSGIIEPGRMTLLLGSSGGGKTSLLKALSGNLDASLKIKMPHLFANAMTCQILGLDICADNMVGDALRRGVSGGEKKRLTPAEMIVGPTKALFMDEITNGLDSSTAFQTIACLQQLAHITDATVLVSLLQSATETFDLFDDLILMSGGKIVYHGPRDQVLQFFEELWVQMSSEERKDQAQYWYLTELPYSYVSVDMFSRKFKVSPIGKKLEANLSQPFDKTKSHKEAISFSFNSLSKWKLIKGCASREFLLMKRNYFIYVFKTSQLIVIAFMAMTVFLRTRMDVDVLHANYYMGALFYALVILLVDGIPEMSMTLQRLDLPLSFVESLVWTVLTYYVIGYSPEVQRFFRHFVLLFAVHLTSISMFHFLASIFRNMASSMAAGSYALLGVSLFSGFIISKPSMPVWLKWGFWLSPLSYGELGLTLNEFLARWQKMLSTNTTIGRTTLESRGLNFDGHLYWISLGALFGFTFVFFVGFVVALSFLHSSGSSHAIISSKKLAEIQASKAVIPFTPLTVVFQDLQYYVGTPLEMRENGFTQKRLQLLCDITGSLRPGVLTALMEIKIGGYPKVQETFARVSGYCEQSDIHSPLITVEESVIFSAWLRLDAQIDSKVKTEFVNQVLETIELDGIKDSLVGIPGVNGLSLEQRKRLTIAVELVANPSIIFLDEPTTGLDARAAAIVMRAIKNIAYTGRTILILLKSGGRMIYAGPLGQQSRRVIAYFEAISQVPKVRDNHNPATWMLEITLSSEAEMGVDVAQLYKESKLYESNKELARQLSTPPADSKDLSFPTLFSQGGWAQFKSCLWKQHLSYWRNPSYNLLRLLYAFVSSLLLGVLFWNKGQKIDNQQDVFNIFGSMYTASIFMGINNCSTVLYYVDRERTVMYRERFAGMYSSWAYSLAQLGVEVPYLFIQAVLFVAITYPMIGYYGSAYKVFWCFYVIFCTFLYYNYMGMMLVSLTPTYMLAAIISSGFYTTFNLFAGFLIPKHDLVKLPGTKSRKATISIINDISGIIEPGRGGKTSLLKSLSGNLDASLKINGEISYNGYQIEEFVPQKTSAYISQYDVHIPEMTVREIVDFSARCQGVGSRAGIMMELSRKEKEAGIIPNPDVDTYMKNLGKLLGTKSRKDTISIINDVSGIIEPGRMTLLLGSSGGGKTSLLKALSGNLDASLKIKMPHLFANAMTCQILGLDICADNMVGDALRRGISGGEKKRLTTAEMIVGPTKALFMDETSNGLDSSTAFQTIACLQQLAHITDATVLEFFEECGFRCPQRKGVADFLQEVISRKDQAQYWYRNELPYSYVSVDMFSRKFKVSPIGKKLEAKLSEPFDKTKSQKEAISFSFNSLSKWELFKACASREFLLMKRNYFIYVFKTSQLIVIALVAMTVFLRTRMEVDVLHAN